MTRLGTEMTRIDSALADPNLFARDPAKATALSKARAETARALAQAEEDWLEASSEYESAMA
jgi:ATP-binding cassette subfamily F protein 3